MHLAVTTALPAGEVAPAGAQPPGDTSDAQGLHVSRCAAVLVVIAYNCRPGTMHAVELQPHDGAAPQQQLLLRLAMPACQLARPPACLCAPWPACVQVKLNLVGLDTTVIVEGRDLISLKLQEASIATQVRLLGRAAPC